MKKLTRRNVEVIFQSVSNSKWLNKKPRGKLRFNKLQADAANVRMTNSKVSYPSNRQPALDLRLDSKFKQFIPKPDSQKPFLS